MAITPQTNLKLLKSTLSLDNMNQIKFASATAQYNYFNSLTKLETSNFTYQRKDNVIRYPAHIDTLMEYDYCMYQNSNYTNKWFYAYIVRMEYVNDNMTNIYIKTDPYQTWQFDLTFKQSFVEREHVNDDTIGANLLPEDLELGEYIPSNDGINVNEYEQMLVCLAVTEYPTGVNPQNVSSKINNIYTGLKYCLFQNLAWVNEFINMYDSSAKSDAIVCIYIVPIEYGISDHTSIVTYGSEGHFFYKPTETSTAFELSPLRTFIAPSSVGTYNPVNKKLLTAPYVYCLVTNNAGQEATFNYEDFVDRNPTFKVYGVLTPGCESKLVPYNYMTGGVSNIYNYMYGLSGAKLPICPWVNDVYLNWLTQNGVNLAVQAASSIGSIIGGAGLLASGVGASKGALMVTGGFASVAQELGSVYSHSLAPKQANGNVNSGDITWATGNSEFTYYEMHIKEEFATRIDKFWSMYGYKVDKLKVPNLTGRRNWNYVKTIDCNIEGYIPQEDLAEIKGMFNNGVTIWHNPSTFLDYSQNNDII